MKHVPNMFVLCDYTYIYVVGCPRRWFDPYPEGPTALEGILQQGSLKGH